VRVQLGLGDEKVEFALLSLSLAKLLFLASFLVGLFLSLFPALAFSLFVAFPEHEHLPPPKRQHLLDPDFTIQGGEEKRTSLMTLLAFVDTSFAGLVLADARLASRATIVERRLAKVSLLDVLWVCALCA
jgi:hypothetical protein